MCVVPFPVPGSASSGTVIFRVPYWNWHLCAWSHFRRFSNFRWSAWRLSLSMFVTSNMRPSQKTKKNERSTQYRKCDFPLPVLVPLLEMGRPFPVLVNCAFGYLHLHSFSPCWYACTFKSLLLYTFLSFFTRSRNSLSSIPPGA